MVKKKSGNKIIELHTNFPITSMKCFALSPASVSVAASSQPLSIMCGVRQLVERVKRRSGRVFQRASLATRMLAASLRTAATSASGSVSRFTQTQRLHGISNPSVLFQLHRNYYISPSINDIVKYSQRPPYDCIDSGKSPYNFDFDDLTHHSP